MERQHTVTFTVDTVMFQGVELIGVYGIKQFAGVGSACVANWQTRHEDFPKPAIETKEGPKQTIRLWFFSDIEAWLIKHGQLRGH